MQIGVSAPHSPVRSAAGWNFTKSGTVMRRPDGLSSSRAAAVHAGLDALTRTEAWHNRSAPAPQIAPVTASSAMVRATGTVRLLRSFAPESRGSALPSGSRPRAASRLGGRRRSLPFGAGRDSRYAAALRGFGGGLVSSMLGEVSSPSMSFEKIIALLSRNARGSNES